MAHHDSTLPPFSDIPPPPIALGESPLRVMQLPVPVWRVDKQEIECEREKKYMPLV